jgi:hypothetical protein
MGLRKAKVWMGPDLITYYEIAAPAGNVVELAAERRRARERTEG